MRAVFAHDHIFYRHEGAYFSPGRLPYAAWQRYLEHFDEVTVVARVHEANAEDVSAMQRADGPRITFCGLSPSRGVRRVLGSSRAERDAVTALLQNADAVVARVPSEIGLSVLKQSERLRLPAACEVVASAWHSLWFHGGVLSKIYAPVFEWRTRRRVSAAGFALYVTRSYLQRKYPCDGVREVASNVTVSVCDDVVPKRLDRIAKNGPLVLGFVGSLHASYKGLDVALLALSRIKDPAIRMDVVGEGSADRWFAKASQLGIADRVRFVGSLPGSAAVQQWLDAVDIYIHPSRAEGLPRSLIEAMSRGCLCIGSRVGGIPELLSEHHLHDPRDADRMASLIEQGVDPQVRRTAATENVAIARSFSQDVLGERRRSFFAQLSMRARDARQPRKGP